MISFWTRLVTLENYKLSSDMYWILYSHDIHNNVRSKWIGIIKTIFNRMWVKRNLGPAKSRKSKMVKRIC